MVKPHVRTVPKICLDLLAQVSGQQQDIRDSLFVKPAELMFQIRLSRNGHHRFGHVPREGAQAGS